MNANEHEVSNDAEISDKIVIGENPLSTTGPELNPELARQIRFQPNRKQRRKMKLNSDYTKMKGGGTFGKNLRYYFDQRNQLQKQEAKMKKQDGIGGAITQEGIGIA